MAWFVKLGGVRDSQGGRGHDSDILLKSRIMANESFS